MKSDFLLAVTQLATERRLPREVVLSAVEAALVSAFKKDAVTSNDITVQILPTTGEIVVTIHKLVVEDVVEPADEMSLADARKINPNAQLGDRIDVEETPQDAGRIAAQTAKQVVMQRLREAERDIVFEEYATRVNELLTGVVQKVEQGQVIISLGRTEAVLLPEESVPSEQYYPRQRLRVLIQEVEKSIRGPRIFVSRAHRDLIRRLFELEVPEIASGTVVIKNVAREPGYRSKVAVEARQEGVDPVGSCVGLRGVRIQNIVNELHGEKIDVIPWNENPEVFISHALSPAQTTHVRITGEKSALVVVPEHQLSLAIGREGLNARLAARLTGWRIDIRSSSEVLAEEAERTARGPELAVAEFDETPAVDAVAAEAVPAIQEITTEPVETPLEAPAAEIATVAAEESEPAVAAETTAIPEPATEIAAVASAPTQTNEEIAAELQKLEEEEAALQKALDEVKAAGEVGAAQEGEPAKGDAESEEDPQRFDFDSWLQQYQSQNSGGDASGGIRFAEDIFPERGGRFRGGRDDRRGGGRRGGGNR